MNGAKIFFIVIGVAVFKFLIVGGSEIFTPSFEVFTVPELDFVDIDCDLFDFTCSSVAQATQNIALLLKFIVVIIVDVLLYLGQLIIFIPVIILNPLPDSPWYINLLLMGVPTMMLIIYVISQFKPGADA